MSILRTALIAAMLIFAGMTVSAQQNRDAAGGAPQNKAGTDTGAPDAKKREAVRKKVEAVRMWRLTEDLKLDEKTSARLASFLSSLDEKRRGLMRVRMDLQRNIRTGLQKEHPDEKKLQSDLDKLDKVRQDMMGLEVKETDGIKEILTVEQQARYVVFQQEFRREMRGMIAGAKEGGPGGRGAGNGPAQQGPGGRMNH